MCEPEDSLNLLQLRSSAGGKHAALQDVVKFLRERAGAEFACNRDEAAKITRKLAEEVEAIRKQASQALDDLNKMVASLPSPPARTGRDG